MNANAAAARIEGLEAKGALFDGEAYENTLVWNLLEA